MLKLLGLVKGTEGLVPSLKTPEEELVTQVIITVRTKGNYIRAEGEKIKAEIFYEKKGINYIHAYASDDYDVVMQQVKVFLETLE